MARLAYLFAITIITFKSCSVQNNAKTEEPIPDWLQPSYNNVVMIDQEQVTEVANNYLIDIPLEEHIDSTYVFFLSTRVPVDLFMKDSGFYPDIQQFILIVPDWEFYEQVGTDAYKQGMAIEPATTNYYYRITRSGEEIKVDSVHIPWDDMVSRVNYVDPKVSKKDLVSYRSESYGSICCPRDPKWDLAEEELSFIKNYEKQNSVKIKGTYRQNNGKEGEHVDYYTLKGLTARQRLDFILAKRSQWIINKETKKMNFAKQIFTPELVPVVTEGFTKMTEVDYGD